MTLLCLCGASTLFLLKPPALLAGKLLLWIFVYGIADCIREQNERRHRFAAAVRAGHRLAATRAQAGAEHERPE